MQLVPEFKDFSSKYKSKKSSVVWAKISADLETPVSASLKLKDENYSCLFESIEGGKARARYSFIAINPDLVWRFKDGKAEINRKFAESKKSFETDGADPFKSFRKLLKESKMKIPSDLPPMASGLFGYMGYDMVKYMEELPSANEDSIGVPDSIFIRPQIVVIFDNIKDELIIVSPVFYNAKVGVKKAYEKASSLINEVVKKLEKSTAKKDYLYDLNIKNSKKLSNFTSNTTRKKFHDIVNKAKEYILAGDIFQVVLSQRFTVDFPYPPFMLYRALRRLNPSPFSFYMKLGDFTLVGSSPEILVRVMDRKVTIRPIAGTRPRGKDYEGDKAMVADLLSDPKELAEHLMLLDLGRNDVGRMAKEGTVKVTEKMKIEYYSHVMHIVSNVEGELDSRRDALDALIAGFPAGTVSGAPKIRAMEIIDELEDEKRSFYAGGIGYFSSGGDMDTCIALRTGLIKGNKLYIQAGGGIVADSDPESEYQESCNKAKALLKAAEEVLGYDSTNR